MLPKVKGPTYELLSCQSVLKHLGSQESLQYGSGLVAEISGKVPEYVVYSARFCRRSGMLCMLCKRKMCMKCRMFQAAISSIEFNVGQS